MRSSSVSAGQDALASEYNYLRDDARGGSFLLPHQTNSGANLRIYIETGSYYIAQNKYTFAGGQSPLFVAPVSNPRIDIVTIDTSGTVAITQGTESATPVAPATPAGKLAICTVYLRVGTTAIYDTNQGSNGYIYADLRPFLSNPSGSSGINDAVITYDSLERISTILDNETGITYTMTYDEDDRLASMTNGSATWTITRDTDGNITNIDIS